MKGQRRFDASGTSRLSAMDLGVGVGVGLLVPLAAEAAIDRWATNSPTMRDNSRMIAGAIGVVLALPLFWWRGLAPTMIAAAVAITYAVLPQLRSGVTQLLGNGAGATSGSAELGRLRAARRRAALGRLRAAQRPVAPAQRGQMQAAGNF